MLTLGVTLGTQEIVLCSQQILLIQSGCQSVGHHRVATIAAMKFCCSGRKQ